MLEYEAVLTRPEHLAAASVVDDVTALLDAVALVAKPVRIHFRWRPLLKDPDDEMVFETAINGKADAIVTFNTRDFGAATDRFGIMTLTPAQALKTWMRANEKK